MGKRNKKSRKVAAQTRGLAHNHGQAQADRQHCKQRLLRIKIQPRETERLLASRYQLPKEEVYDPGPSDPHLRRLWEHTKKGDLDWEDALVYDAWERSQAVRQPNPQAADTRKPDAVRDRKPRAVYTTSTPPRKTWAGHSSPCKPGRHTIGCSHRRRMLAMLSQSTADLLASMCGLHPVHKADGVRVAEAHAGQLTAGSHSGIMLNSPPTTQSNPSLLGPLARSIGLEWSDAEEDL